MSVVTAFSVPSDDFQLGRLLQSNSQSKIRLERLIPSAATVVPYFWIPTEQFDSLVQLTENSNVIDDVTIVDATTAETLFRVHWAEDPDDLLLAIAESDGKVLNAEGKIDTWFFEARFVDIHSLSTFFRLCEDYGISVKLEGMYSPEQSGGEDQMPLTLQHLETVKEALEAGYYDVPQRTTLDELSESLGIPKSMLSQQLKEAEALLLKSML